MYEQRPQAWNMLLIILLWQVDLSWGQVSMDEHEWPGIVRCALKTTGLSNSRDRTRERFDFGA